VDFGLARLNESRAVDHGEALGSRLHAANRQRRLEDGPRVDVYSWAPYLQPVDGPTSLHIVLAGDVRLVRAGAGAAHAAQPGFPVDLRRLSALLEDPPGHASAESWPRTGPLSGR